MHFRRILTLLLVFSILASLNICALANGSDALEPAAHTEDFDERLNLLDALDILKVTELDLSAKMSRGEFCAAAYRLYGINSADYTGESAFVDVTDTTVGFKEINSLHTIGIISGSADGNFYPQMSITGCEAVKIVTEILGFGSMAQYYGGWTSGYMAVANKYKLLANVKSSYDAPITTLDAAYLLYNSLFAVLPDVAGIKLSHEKRTLLSDVFHVYNIEGKITANDFFAIGGGKAANVEKVIIDSKEYGIGKTDIEDYVGYTANVYYRNEIDSSDPEIIWFGVSNNNDILVLDSENIISFKNNEYLYTNANSNSVKSVKISTGTDIIYNKSSINYDEKNMLPKKGTVTLIDSDSNGDYDVVNILSYKNIVVGSVSVEDKIISGKYDAEPIDLSGDDTVVDIKDVYGVDFTIDNLFEWDVLTYIESVSGKKKRFEATLVRDYIYGTLNSIGGLENRDVIVDRKAAKISANYPMTDKYKLQVGYKGDFLLDKFGEIVAFVNSPENEWKFGYFIKLTDVNGFKGGNAVIFSEKTNSVGEYNFAKKVNVDGVRTDADSDTVKALGNGGGQLVRFMVNKSGEIVKIDTTAADYNGSSNDSLVKYVETVPSGSERRYNNNATIGFNCAVGSKTKIFIVPTIDNRYKYDMYAIKDQGFLKQFSTTYSFNSLEAFRTSEDALIADAVVFYFDYANGMPRQIQNNIAVVKDIKRVLTEEGEDAQKITMLELGSIVELFADSDYGLEVGDGIQYGKDYRGYITDVRKIWDYTDDIDSIRLCDGIVTYPIGGNFDATFRVQIGYVYASKGGLIAVCKNKPIGVVPNEELELHAISNFKIEVVDSTGRDVLVRSGSADDILDWRSYGDDCSKIAIFTKNSVSRNITIFK